MFNEQNQAYENLMVMADIFTKMIAGECISVDTNQPMKLPVKEVVVARGLVSNMASHIKTLALGNRYLVVSDVNTHPVAGEKIQKDLKAKGLILPNGVQASDHVVTDIRKAAAMCDVLIAVGSGAINDLCKYASYLDGKSYVVCGTAPSMNGYLSANASITINGYKSTQPAQLPMAVYMDVDICKKAPIRLIQSGLGDSLCRPTAQADWMLSHLLLDTPYLQMPFYLLAQKEQTLFANAKGLASRDDDVIALLIEILLLSGVGMYLAGGSFPASQAEHMIAHTMHMLYGNSLPQTYHGEEIGVATLVMTKLQQKILDAPAPVVTFKNMPMNGGHSITEECKAQYQDKLVVIGDKDTFNQKLHEKWDKIIEAITAIMLPEATLVQALQDASCAIKPSGIGWKNTQLEMAIKTTKYTRNRFTFLDIA